MIKLIIKITLMFFIITGLSSCNEVSFVEYKPHYLNKDSRERSHGSPKLDPVEFANTIQVLKYYGNEYKTRTGNIILITNELNKDWELMWNYTSKANDANWLKAHKPK